MVRIIVVLTDRGVEEVRVPGTSLADERASRDLLDRISPVISSLHQLIVGEAVVKETSQAPIVASPSGL